MRNHPIPMTFWGRQENVGIWDIKNAKNRLSGYFSDFRQHSSVTAAVKFPKRFKITPTDRLGAKRVTGFFWGMTLNSPPPWIRL